jgi:hypothetical protein
MKLRNREIPTIERKFYTRQPYNIKDLQEILLFGRYERLYRSKKTEIAYKNDLKKGKILVNHFNGRLQLKRNTYPYNFKGIQHWILIYHPRKDEEHRGWNLFTEKYLKAVSELNPEVSWINPPKFRSQKHIPHAHLVFKTKWEPPLEYLQTWI